MKKFEKFLDTAEAVTCILFGVTMIIATLLIVFWRRVLNSPFTIGEELARYLTVWFIYIGVTICAKRRGHLGVEAFTMMMPEKVRSVVAKLADLLTIVMFAFLTYSSVLMMLQYAATSQKSTMMHLPMTLVFCIVPVSLTLSAVHYIINFIHSLKPETENGTSEVTQ